MALIEGVEHFQLQPEEEKQLLNSLLVEIISVGGYQQTRTEVIQGAITRFPDNLSPETVQTLSIEVYRLFLLSLINSFVEEYTGTKLPEDGILNISRREFLESNVAQLQSLNPFSGCLNIGLFTSGAFAAAGYVAGGRMRPDKKTSAAVGLFIYNIYTLFRDTDTPTAKALRQHMGILNRFASKGMLWRAMLETVDRAGIEFAPEYYEEM